VEASIDVEAIEAAIGAIEAQYGLTRDQLLADESEIGRTYRLLLAQSNRAREDAIEAVFSSSVERGITRSGITAEGVADVETLAAEQSADFIAQEAAQRAQIQNEISQAEGAAAAARLSAAQGISGQLLTEEEIAALVAGGVV
jgi:hypothetical protein